MLDVRVYPDRLAAALLAGAVLALEVPMLRVDVLEVDASRLVDGAQAIADQEVDLLADFPGLMFTVDAA